ncbi:MAG: chromosome segregation protein SMC [Actinobacteria bacterium]|nr:chromosome segregation protein SMC [Actinomycetota bacterium]NBQ00717.1 chromosome segregation protein SMC [Actinomycetota bacterium]NBY50007.1 chromosome segregation protein SMC [Actinomycetota bacterium]NDC81158.1 chromosome segregation protein SMC [Actinomycetota bacterium]NDE26434.1 chromosome segregation protein SMC [Actinomycetota bacterium]
MTLKGFKSFAAPTTLKFEPGITCVVGPNGSGKSNVVDALSWVMGEQGAKSLRGGKMEDVIFAGTSGRAPLGRAEVSVTIDNADGALPIEFSEVTISRTLFRNGQSDYQINGESARLLDIQELLSDSGIGREMHVIVGQGQLDAILTANPEERRGFIEEAAGILKHRKRKEKALRKLESMQGNMSRVQDLTNELRRQLRPLGKQAEVARKAAVIQADVRDAKLRILADDLIAFNSTLSLEVADETALRQRRDEVDQELDQLRKREIELDQIAAIQGPELAQAQNNYYSLTAQKEKLRGIQNLASERARFLAEEADEARASGRDPEVLETEAKVLRGEQSILQGSSDKASAELAAASNSVNQLEVRLKGEEDRVAAAQRALADYREGTARQEGHIKSLQSRIDGAGSEINRLESALAGARTRVAESKVEFARLESEIAGLDAGELGLDAEFERAKALLNGSKANLEKLRSDLWLAERAKAAAEAKIDALRQATLHKDGSGALLTNNQGIQIRGSLASLLTIEPGWQSAVTSALGSLADALVLQDLSQVISAISFLKSTSAGSAELLFFSEADSSAVIEIPNGLTPLASKVSSATLNSMLPALFSGFVVADSLSQANQIISGSSSLIAVTKDGDLVGSGRARGGSSARTTLIEISEIIERGEIELQKHSHDCDRIHFDLSTAETKLTSDQLNYDQVLARLNESDAAMAALAEQMAAASQGVKSASGEVERLEKSIVEVKQALNIDLDELVIAKSEFEKSSEPSEPELSSLENLRATLATARAVEVEARLALRTIEERVAAISQRAKDLELAAATERQAASNNITRRAARARGAVTAQGIADAAYEALIQIEISISRANSERERLEVARSNRDGEILSIRQAIRDLSAELDQLTSSVHRDEIARAEQRLRIEQLEIKAMEEFGVDSSSLINEYAPDKPVPTFIEDDAGNLSQGEFIPYIRAEQEKRLAGAEKSLALLGKINPLALEEFSSLEERLKYLADQLEDLKKSKKDLLDIIKSVDDKVQEIFEEAFRDTAREFEKIFARLFPGGEGRLLLTDPRDLLNSGVDVEARPPGKRIKRLSLLSGGERSLTAVALLVAIFKARPSPFYVLDEVEAALDDTNLGRLLSVLEELRQASQLIIITHQKRTMEIGDTLYGVSMRGDGVSEVISQRLREIETEPA